MTRTRHTDGSFTTAENNRLTAFNDARGLVEMDRPTYEEDPEKSVSNHWHARCRWWHRGAGILVTAPDFRPAQIMAERETPPR